MKKVFLFFAAIISSLLVQSQSPTFMWAKGLCGSSQNAGYDIAIDPLGNVYTIGSFEGTGDFDPGAGVFNLTPSGAKDIFISKLDAFGNFVWAKKIGGNLYNIGLSITLDANGNLYATGSFKGTTDFDPGAGIFNLTSPNYEDIFILKLDASGNFLWVKGMGGILSDNGSSIALDTFGNMYISGYFDGTADFDPGAGTYTLSSAAGCVFIAKLNSSGSFIWAKNMGGNSNDGAFSIALDAFGNVVTTGVFYGTRDFDPGAGIFNLTSAGYKDQFVSKLDTSGNFIWAKKMGGTLSDIGYSIATDSLGNIYTTGMFEGTPDFDPGPSIYNLASSGSIDVFVSKLDGSGNFVWAKNMGGTSIDVGAALTLDASGNIYITGSFEGTADFDPGAGTFTLISGGGKDIFISKLNAIGNFVWAKNMGGSLLAHGSSVSVDSSGYVYTTGFFSNLVDFDPGAAIFNLAASGAGGSFIHKMNQCAPFVNINSTAVLLCAGSSATLTATGANNYLWNTGATTASIVVSPTISTTYTVTGIDPNECFTSQTINITVNICTALTSSNLENGHVNIYPNPSIGILNIEINDKNETVSVQLTNTLGQIVLNEKINYNHSAFDISHLPGGFYFIKMISDLRKQAFKLVKE